MHRIIIASLAGDYDAAAVLFKEYASWLNIDLSFQDFESEMLKLPLMYGPPKGAIILYKIDETYAGCVAIRMFDTDTAEMKRMYVRPSFRNKGVGKTLLDEAISFSINNGYKRIVLDTLRHMKPAMKLYSSNGFVEIPAYYFNPEESAVYFEKKM